MVAASPDQRSKILRFSLAVDGELLVPTPTKVKLMAAAIARKNCLKLIARNLNKGASAIQVEESLKTLIGEKNVINVYFPRTKGGLHTRVANVELLNIPIYKKFVNKTHKLQSKYVCFNPHPRSLDGTATPTEEMLCEWGFHDLNTTLANTVEAMENATTTTPKQKTTTKGEISTMVKDAIAAGAQTFKHEIKADMQVMKEDILAESHTYTDIMTQDLRSRIEGQLGTINNQFQTLMESLSNTRKMLNDTPQCLALPPPAPRYSN